MAEATELLWHWFIVPYEPGSQSGKKHQRRDKGCAKSARPKPRQSNWSSEKTLSLGMTTMRVLSQRRGVGGDSTGNCGGAGLTRSMPKV